MGQPSPLSPPILSGDNKGSTAEKGKEAQKIATDGADAQGNTVGGHIGTQFREARHWRPIWTFYSFIKARYREKGASSSEYKYSLLDKLLLYMGFDRCSRREERQRLGTAPETCAGPTFSNSA